MRSKPGGGASPPGYRTPDGGGGRVPYSDDALYRKLVWLTAFRLLTVTALLLATIGLGGRPEPLISTVPGLLYGLIGGIYALSLGYIVALKRWRRLDSLAFWQVAGDVCIASFLVYLTGGSESLFTIFYPLAIVNASIVLPRSGAVSSAIASAATFAVVAVGLRTGIMPPAASYLAPESVPLPRFVLGLFVNGSAFVLTAGLSSYLAEQVQRAGEQLTESQADLAELSALHGSIVQSIHSGILTTDADGKITFMNPAALQMAGAQTEEISGRDLVATFPLLSAACAAAAAAGKAHGEATLRGGTQPVAFFVSPLTAPARGTAIMLEDLTTLRRMEEAVRRAEGLAAAGRLAAGLAHEIRNPLASMCGSVELLRSGLQLSPDNNRLFDIVMREGERLNALVTDFLAFARPASPQLSEVDLGSLVEETLGVFANAPTAGKATLRPLVDRFVVVRADADQLRQVLWNLLVNAVQAMPNGGAATVRAFAQGPYAVVQVEDEGEGILSSDMPHLFEPFFTTKPAGTGLGLATVHRIVDGLGGRVEVQSERGRGSRFSIKLPLKNTRLTQAS